MKERKGTRRDGRPGGPGTDTRTIVYGLHAVRARLRQGTDGSERLLVLARNASPRVAELCALARNGGIAIEEVGRGELDRIAEGRHQGVALVCAARPVRGEEWLDEMLRDPDPARLILVLDGVTDPHNLGACLRSAAALGVDVVVAPKDRAAGLTPTAIKVASGGADIVPLIQVTNLARTIDRITEAGVWVIGLAAGAVGAIGDADLTGPLALVLGSEASGLRRLTAEKCDLLVRIPLATPAGSESGARATLDSLNVSVATGIALYEVSRQRGKRMDG